MTEPQPERPNPVRDAILDLVADRGVGKTICPTEAAKQVSADAWRKVLVDVRAEAVRLAKAGEISIYRKGRPVDPSDFKGVYRLGLPGKPAPGA
ncbi:MAG: DUF3253 domain-containing protein [Pseudomonadota bacterium]